MARLNQAPLGTCSVWGGGGGRDGAETLATTGRQGPAQEHEGHSMAGNRHRAQRTRLDKVAGQVGPGDECVEEPEHCHQQGPHIPADEHHNGLRVGGLVQRLRGGAQPAQAEVRRQLAAAAAGGEQPAVATASQCLTNRAVSSSMTVTTASPSAGFGGVGCGQVAWGVGGSLLCSPGRSTKTGPPQPRPPACPHTRAHRRCRS